jgi:preprotein translocase subunit SecG
MYTLIVVLIIFCAVLLVIAVLAQNSKGGGLSGQFGGSGASNMFGVRKTGDFLEKSTWVLAITIIVLSMTTTMSFIGTPKNQPSNEIYEKAGEQGTSGQTPVAPILPDPGAVTPADSTK